MDELQKGNLKTSSVEINTQSIKADLQSVDVSLQGILAHLDAIVWDGLYRDVIDIVEMDLKFAHIRTLAALQKLAEIIEGEKDD